MDEIEKIADYFVFLSFLTGQTGSFKELQSLLFLTVPFIYNVCGLSKSVINDMCDPCDKFLTF